MWAFSFFLLLKTKRDLSLFSTISSMFPRMYFQFPMCDLNIHKIGFSSQDLILQTAFYSWASSWFFPPSFLQNAPIDEHMGTFHWSASFIQNQALPHLIQASIQKHLKQKTDFIAVDGFVIFISGEPKINSFLSVCFLEVYC